MSDHKHSSYSRYVFLSESSSLHASCDHACVSHYDFIVELLIPIITLLLKKDPPFSLHLLYPEFVGNCCNTLTKKSSTTDTSIVSSGTEKLAL